MHFFTPPMEASKPISLFELLQGLPPEILAMILLLAVKRDGLGESEEARWRGTLCLVCKPWCESLYDTPQAWTRVSLVFDSNTALSAVRACLANSRGALKQASVEIYKTRHVPDVFCPPYSASEQNRMIAFIHTAFTVLDPYFPRISIFRMVCPETVSSELALAYLSRMDCRRLKELKIVMNLSSDPELIGRRLTFASTLPALVTLYTAKSIPPSTLLFAGAHITDLQLVTLFDDTLTWHNLRAVLAAFPNLTSLKLGSVICSEFLHDSQKLTIPQLSHIDFVLSMPTMISVLYQLVAPSLSSLRLTLRDGRGVRWMMRECSIMGQAIKVDLHIVTNFSEELVMDVLSSFTAVSVLDVTRCAFEVQETILLVLFSPHLRLEHLSVIDLGWWIDEWDEFYILEGDRFGEDCLCQAADWPEHRKLCKMRDTSLEAFASRNVPDEVLDFLRWFDHWQPSIQRWAVYSADLAHQSADFLAQNWFGMRSNKEVLDELNRFPVINRRRALLKDFRRAPRRVDGVRILVMTPNCCSVESAKLSYLFPDDQSRLFSARDDPQSRSLSTELKLGYIDGFASCVRSGTFDGCRKLIRGALRNIEQICTL
ncbi:hypothetical protein DFH06DRAFT_1153057 [Mycena polygramma]|nr:hypothetical protein DFH06DRAFT_1153057 [Mycena polygramma]